MSHRVILTGGSGTLGRNFLELAARRMDMCVLALLRPESRIPTDLSNVQVARVDLLDTESVERLVREFEPTSIVHCAATGMEFPRTRWFDLVRVNVNMAVSFCEMGSFIPGCQFLFVSTGLVYGNLDRPARESDHLETTHPYGASKAAADILVRSAAAEFEVPLTVLRPFSFTGLGDDRTRLFGSLLRAASHGVPFDLSACEHVRDHCSARDIARGIMASIDRPNGPELARVVNLGSGLDEPLRNIIESVVKQLGLDIHLRFDARGLRRSEPLYLVADISRADRLLGWRPTHNLAHAVWELASEAFPDLRVTEPTEHL